MHYWLDAVFPLNAKKVQICEIMSGRFAVKIQQCVKSPAIFGNFFRLLKFLQFSTNCLMLGRLNARNQRLGRSFFRAVQRLAQTSSWCNATANDGDLKYRARQNYTSFILEINPKARNIKKPVNIYCSKRAVIASSSLTLLYYKTLVFEGSLNLELLNFMFSLRFNAKFSRIVHIKKCIALGFTLAQKASFCKLEINDLLSLAIFKTISKKEYGFYQF